MADAVAGRVALVTGASSGIGAAIARGLAAAGVRVALSARRADRLDALVQEVADAGGEAIALPGDVADEAVATTAVAQTVARLGRIDILVNSAGISALGTLETFSTAEYRRLLDVNVLGTLYTCKAAVPHMRAQGSGDIINVTSLAGRKSGAITGAYSASKHAANALTDSLRMEVGGYGIRVCTLMPGATTTEVANSLTDPAMRAMMQAHVTKEGAVSPDDIAEAVLLVVALPRRASISEITVRPTSDTTP